VWDGTHKRCKGTSLCLSSRSRRRYGLRLWSAAAVDAGGYTQKVGEGRRHGDETQRSYHNILTCNCSIKSLEAIDAFISRLRCFRKRIWALCVHWAAEQPKILVGGRPICFVHISSFSPQFDEQKSRGSVNRRRVWPPFIWSAQFILALVEKWASV
jgi:hypothetical protein